YDAAAEYGETASVWLKRAWDTSPKYYYYWPDENWTPSGDENDYYNDPVLHWGWEKTYLQLRPESWSSLDTIHDLYVATPEPGTAIFALIAVGAAAWVRRRKKKDTIH
ncbi:MAG: PEP-CTERM sorting domain-containing protein, partial [Candidatus Brocadiae bacterium]|nr:PEP-CTERM sorting domain-containing protein [Candidatus Brocadiia bacterium]